jgi:peroxiredoxin Q/BCP
LGVSVSASLRGDSQRRLRYSTRPIDPEVFVHRVIRSLLAVSFIVAGSVSAQAQAGTDAAPPAHPAVGDVAPDFTLPVAGRDGVASEPISLAKLRGKVVVLAFYPADRTSGCTAEMTKFRDEYAKLFGDGVVLLPISKDGLDSHTSWAKDMNMPFVLGSDTTGSVARSYGSQSAPGRGFSRNVFIIGKDGKIAHTVIRLNALSEDAYTALGQAVTAAKQKA